MASEKIQNTILAGTIVLAAVTGTVALPRIANNPTLLYVAGQVQIATGHRDNGLSLISRAALSTPDNDVPAAKPSPAKTTANCSFEQKKVVPKASVSVTRIQKNISPMNVNEDFYFQKVSKQLPNAPMMVKFEVPREAMRKVNTEEINRQVRIMQERINRQMQKTGVGSRVSVAG